MNGQTKCNWTKLYINGSHEFMLTRFAYTMHSWHLKSFRKTVSSWDNRDEYHNTSRSLCFFMLFVQVWNPREVEITLIQARFKYVYYPKSSFFSIGLELKLKYYICTINRTKYFSCKFSCLVIKSIRKTGRNKKHPTPPPPPKKEKGKTNHLQNK